MTNHEIPELDSKGLRSFGLTTGAIVMGLFGLFFPWLLEVSIPKWPFILGGVLGAWGLVHPNSLGPIYKGWMKFGLLISKITTPIVLGIVFFLVLMPMGLILRLFRDPMNRKVHTDDPSYRVIHEPTEQSMERPF